MNNQNNFDDLEIHLAGVFCLIATVSQNLYESAIENIKTLNDLDNEEKTILDFMIAYTVLYITYKELLKLGPIENEDAKVGLYKLVKLFKMHYGTDPLIFLSDVTSEVSYLPLRLSDALSLQKGEWISTLEGLVLAYTTMELDKKSIEEALNSPIEEKLGYLNGIAENEDMNRALKDENERFVMKLKRRLNIT